MSAERIEKIAADWFERRMSGQWTGGDQAQLTAWLEASPAHEIQYLRIEAAWNHIARLRALGAGVSPGEIPRRHAWGDTRFFRGTAPHSQLLACEVDDPAVGRATSEGHSKINRRARLLASAAAMLCVAVSGAYVYQNYVGIQRYTTSIGGLQKIALEDGSRVTLNTDTRLSASLRSSERRIELARGEAFFDVAKDPRRPFIVEAGNRRIVVVGTKFSVRRDGNNIRVVVTEGKVRVETESDATVAARDGGKPGDDFLLTAGAVVHASRTGVQVREEAAAAEKLLSWRNGYVSFDNAPLAEAVAEFNRYRSAKILIEDPSIAGLLIGGNFRSDNSEAFLAVLENGFSIDIQRREDGIILKARH